MPRRSRAQAVALAKRLGRARRRDSRSPKSLPGEHGRDQKVECQMNVALAMLASAAAFPAMLFERLLPIKPDPKLIAYQYDRSRYHNLKNQTTERFRADAQWWSKFMCFLVVIAFALGWWVG